MHVAYTRTIADLMSMPSDKNDLPNHWNRCLPAGMADWDASTAVPDEIPHLANACSPTPCKVDEKQGDMETHKTCQALDGRRINRDESYPLRMFLPARMTSSTSKS